MQWEALLPFLIDEETEAYIQRNGMTYSELHIPMRGKGKFIDKHFDSEFHLPSPKRRWCCGAHVKRRAWVKATERRRNRERAPPPRFHSASYPPVTLLGEAAERNKKIAAFRDSKVCSPHLFLLQLLTKTASSQASKRSSLVFSICLLSIEGDSNHRSSIFLSLEPALSREGYEW